MRHDNHLWMNPLFPKAASFWPNACETSSMRGKRDKHEVALMKWRVGHLVGVREQRFSLRRMVAVTSAEV